MKSNVRPPEKKPSSTSSLIISIKTFFKLIFVTDSHRKKNYKIIQRSLELRYFEFSTNTNSPLNPREFPVAGNNVSKRNMTQKKEFQRITYVTRVSRNVFITT